MRHCIKMERRIDLAMAASGGSRTEKMKVTVCIITYQRPEGLKRLLEGLNKLSRSR